MKFFFALLPPNISTSTEGVFSGKINLVWIYNSGSRYLQIEDHLENPDDFFRNALRGWNFSGIDYRKHEFFFNQYVTYVCHNVVYVNFGHAKVLLSLWMPIRKTYYFHLFAIRRYLLNNLTKLWRLTLQFRNL